MGSSGTARRSSLRPSALVPNHFAVSKTDPRTRPDVVATWTRKAEWLRDTCGTISAEHAATFIARMALPAWLRNALYEADRLERLLAEDRFDSKRS